MRLQWLTGGLTKAKIRSAIYALACVGVATPISAADPDPGFVIIKPNEFDWGPDLTRIKTIVLHGDPSRPGWYIIRIRFPAGTTTRPHYHDQDRFVTVIEGTWYAGTSATFDAEKMVAIRPGGFMKHPANAVHFDGAKEEAVIVEIRGMGPVTTKSAATRDTASGRQQQGN